MSYTSLTRGAAIPPRGAQRPLLLTACLGLALAPALPTAQGQGTPKKPGTQAAAPKAGAPAAAPAAPAPTAEENAAAMQREIDKAAIEIEDQLVPMGMDVQNVLKADEVSGLEKIFSRERFAYEVMKGIDYGEKLPPEMGGVLGEAANMGVLFYNWEPVAQFKFLRIRSVGGRLGLFMRCVHGNGSVSYFTFFLGPGPDGSGLRVTDIHNHRAAHLRSTIARHFMAYNVVRKGLLPQEKVNIEISMRDLTTVGEIGQSLAARKTDAVNRMYESLSAQAKALPMIVMLKMAASLDNEQQLLEVASTMNQIAPEEIAQDLMIMDHFMGAEKWDEAIAAIQKLDEKVGGDPYLTLRMARCQYEKGEQALAGKTAVEAIRKEPELHAAYMLLLDIEVDKKNYAGAYKMLKLLADKFQLVIQPQEFDKSKDYEGFIASPEFKQWSEYAASKTGAANGVNAGATPTAAPAAEPAPATAAADTPASKKGKGAK